VVEQRRSPALTAAVRERIIEAIVDGTFCWGTTVYELANEYRLTPDQVRDAVWAPSADAWRREHLPPIY